MQKDAADALSHMGAVEEKHAICMAEGVVPALVRLLGSDSATVQEYAAGVLAHLAGSGHDIFATEDTHLALLQLLKSGSTAVHEQAANALEHLICYIDTDALLKEAIKVLDAPDATSGEAGDSASLPCFEHAASLTIVDILKSTAPPSQGKIGLIVRVLTCIAPWGNELPMTAEDCEAVSLRICLLQSTSTLLKEAGRQSLSNSPFYCSVRNFANIGLPSLMRLLTSEIVVVRKQALRILDNLLPAKNIADHCNIRVALAAGGAIPPLVRMLESVLPAVQEKAANVLGKLSFDNSNNQAQVAAAGAISLLSQLLGPWSHPKVQEAAAGALAVLFCNSDNRIKMAAVSAIPFFDGVKASTWCSKSHSKRIQASILHSVSKVAKVQVLEAGTVPVAITVLNSERAALVENLLCILTWEGDSSTGQPDAEAAQLVVSAGAMPRLLEMAQTPHLAFVALRVMANLAINTRAEMREPVWSGCLHRGSAMTMREVICPPPPTWSFLPGCTWTLTLQDSSVTMDASSRPPKRAQPLTVSRS